MSAPTTLPSQATTNAAGPAQNHLPTTLPNNPSTGAQSLDGSAPTSPPGLDHAVSLLNQFIAAGMSEQQVGGNNERCFRSRRSSNNSWLILITPNMPHCRRSKPRMSMTSGAFSLTHSKAASEVRLPAALPFVEPGAFGKPPCPTTND